MSRDHRSATPPRLGRRRFLAAGFALSLMAGVSAQALAH